MHCKIIFGLGNNYISDWIWRSQIYLILMAIMKWVYSLWIIFRHLFLWIGIILEMFNLSGKIPFVITWFIIMVSGSISRVFFVFNKINRYTIKSKAIFRFELISNIRDYIFIYNMKFLVCGVFIILFHNLFELAWCFV